MRIGDTVQCRETGKRSLIIALSKNTLLYCSPPISRPKGKVLDLKHTFTCFREDVLSCRKVLIETNHWAFLNVR